MKAHEAQPDNLPLHRMLMLLTGDVSILLQTHAAIGGKRPSRAAKDLVRRELAGVIADLETIRLGLK